MQIILVHSRLAQARTLTVKRRHVALAALAAVTAILGTAIILNFIILRSTVSLSLPGLRSFVQAAVQNQSERNDKYVQDNLNAMAVKLGQMQAQLMRLEALGERVSGLAGVSPQEFNFREPPPRGGAEPTSARDLTMQEFQAELGQIAQNVERRGDYLDVVETALMTSKLKSKMMPTIQPVNVSYNSSGFGPRLDPFTGKLSFHSGIDFVAATGVPIVAAAGGVVIAAEWHHDFGNMIEIDHGNDISTLYGHASRVYVHVGDIVHRNQHIADVGSTGRATGSHLHFEVHVKGVPQNPAKFLDVNSGTALASATKSVRQPPVESAPAVQTSD